MKKSTTIAAALLAATLANAQTAFVAEPARTADDFIESIGVCTHWGYRNTVYGQKWPELKRLITELGVRHTRTGLEPRVAELFEASGIRNTCVVGPYGNIAQDEEKWWAERLDSWAANKAAIAMLEGPNEVNGGGTVYQGKGWPEGPRLFQAEFYKRVKGDPRTADIPVIGFSLAYRGQGRVAAPVTGCDFANDHSYAGGGPPASSVNLNDPQLMFGRGAEILPVIVTESGYHTCVPHDTVIAGNQQGVSREAHRKYIPRHFAEYFNAGIVRTFSYELAAGRPNKKENEDPEAAFGLLDPDGEPKAAYFALKNLIAALNEEDREAARSHEPGVLVYALEPATPTLHHTLLQKADGAFVLLLWNEVSSFDLRTKKDTANKPLDIHLRLQTAASSAIVIPSLGNKDDAARKHIPGPVGELALQINDEITVVELAPPVTGWANGQIPAAPEVTVEPAATSVTLSWPVITDETGWVSGHGPKKQAQKSADGKTWQFTVGGLIPDRVYSFEVVATTPDGERSEPARVKAHTLGQFPDLIVKQLNILDDKRQPIADTDNIKAGTKISFSAVVENIGNAPTPDGVTIGVKFGVNGRTVAWHDATKKSLAPGETITCVANSGPQGANSFWTVLPGGHKALAEANDANRFIESDHANNKLETFFGTGDLCDLTVSVNAAELTGDKKSVTVTVSNIGKAALNAGDTLSVTIYDRATPPRKNFGYITNRAGLPAGGKLVVTIPVAGLPEVLPETFCVVVDDQNRIRESDKANNSALIPHDHKPAPKPQSLAVPGGKADLVIAVTGVDIAGAQKTIAVKVSNIGDADVAEGEVISATVFDKATPPRRNFGYTTTRAGLPAGQSLNLTIPVANNLPASLPDTFCVVADDMNRIVESDKTNNSALVFPKP
ncbi:MAG: hypothetical protein FWF96_05700 [Kiritimatiellaeota bacterium]|nr:hypothetical protein [Kiritimatiellota bacterium]